MLVKPISTPRIQQTLLAGLASLLIACGGSSAGGTDPVTVKLGGVMATGAAVVGATVTLTDAKGATRIATTAINGSYDLDITGLTAPFVIRGQVAQGDSTLVMMSVVASTPSSNAVANITPLTNAVVTLLAPAGVDTANIPSASITVDAVNTAVTNLKIALGPVLTANGLGSDFNPMSTPFTANRTGADAVLEMVEIQPTGAGIQITNTAAPDSASVSITGVAGLPANAPAGTAPPAPAALPAVPAGYQLGYLDHFKAQLEACFAQPVATRVVIENGTVIDALGACKYDSFRALSPYYISGGYSIMRRYNSMLKDEAMTGAVFSLPQPLFNFTVGTDVGNATFFKMNYTRTDGEKGIITDVARKTNTYTDANKWQIHGNQRLLDVVIEGRATKYTQLNPNAGSTELSRYQAQLRIVISPFGPGGYNIQLAKVTGPGLPANGVVMARSATCGTYDYLAFANKTGSLTDAYESMIWYTGSSSNAFTLSQTAMDSAKTLAWPSTNHSYSTVELTQDEIANMPNFGLYTVAVYNRNADGSYKSTLPSTPDATYTVRNTSRPPSLAQVRSMQFNEFTASSKLYLDPSNALAAATNTFSLAWTRNPLAEPVESVIGFGSRSTAGQWPVRVQAQLSARASETSKTLTSGALPAGYVDSRTDCSAAQFPALGSTGTLNASNQYTGSYRDITLRSRDSTLVRKYNTVAWSNYPNIPTPQSSAAQQ